MTRQYDDEVQRDNDKAADHAALMLIGMGYAWNGNEWTKPEDAHLVQNDGRVAEVVAALAECVEDMKLTEEYYGPHDGAQDAIRRAEAALAAMESAQ